MFGGDVVVFEAIGFFVGYVDDPFDARRHIDLGLTSAAIRIVQFSGRSGAPRRRADAELRYRRLVVPERLDRAAGLLDERQQEMLGIELRMTIALYDLVGASERVLSAFGESVKSHHRPSFFLTIIIIRTEPGVNETNCRGKGDIGFVVV